MTTLQLVPYVQDIRQRDPDTGLLVIPASVMVLARGSTTSYAALFTDNSGTTALANPMPTGVAPPASTAGTLSGVDTAGNAGFWIAPGLYDLIVDGSRFPIIAGAVPADLLALIAEVQAWTASNIPVDTTNGAQGPSIQAAIDALVAGGVGGSSVCRLE